MKIRLMGLPEEVDAALELIRAGLDVIEVSRPYASRGESQQVRVYVEAREKPEQAGPVRATAVRADRPELPVRRELMP